MVRVFSLAIVMLSFGLWWGELAPATAGEAPLVLERGIYPARQEAGVLVAHGADALLRLYQEELSFGSKPPAVDFDRYVVVAIFGGSQPSGGYGLEIIRASFGPKELDLRYRLTSPSKEGRHTQALTNPYVVLLLFRENQSE